MSEMFCFQCQQTAGGIDRKVKLLALERADMSGLFIPARGTAL